VGVNEFTAKIFELRVVITPQLLLNIFFTPFQVTVFSLTVLCWPSYHKLCCCPKTVDILLWWR